MTAVELTVKDMVGEADVQADIVKEGYRISWCISSR